MCPVSLLQLCVQQELCVVHGSSFPGVAGPLGSGTPPPFFSPPTSFVVNVSATHHLLFVFSSFAVFVIISLLSFFYLAWALFLPSS